MTRYILRDWLTGQGYVRHREDPEGGEQTMDLSEFRIGAEFTCDDKRYRCTDIGTRVVVGIRVDEIQMTRSEPGKEPVTRTLTGEEAEAIGWFSGPPYGVVEQVFDEDDREICEPV